MPITRARRRQESQWCVHAVLSETEYLAKRSCATGRTMPRPYPRAWALKTLPLALSPPLPPCHLSAVTLLDPSPSSCLCTKCLRIPLVFSKPRARYMAAYGSSWSTQPFLTCTDTPGQTRPFKFIFSLFFPFAPCLRQRLPKFGTGPPTVPAMGRLFFCLSLFFILSTPRLRRIRWGERRGGFPSLSLRAL